ncbi:hypothetical protein ACWCPT_11605 [Streptomyces sp. NPDC002308]
MDERDREWAQVEAGLARNRRGLGRAARRTKRRSAAVAVPHPVAPPDARRRRLRGAGGVWAAWVVVVLVDAMLIRAHVLTDACTAIAATAGAVAGPLLLGIHHGWAGQPFLTECEGRHRVSARTLTGVRTVDLDGLVSVRRFETVQRGRPYLDQFRLHDRHGIRLTVDNGPTLNAALRRALLSPRAHPDHADGEGSSTVRTTRHARTALGELPPSRVRRAMHRFWGLWMTAASILVPAVVSYLTACALAGRSL